MGEILNLLLVWWQSKVWIGVRREKSETTLTWFWTIYTSAVRLLQDSYLSYDSVARWVLVSRWQAMHTSTRWMNWTSCKPQAHKVFQSCSSKCPEQETFEGVHSSLWWCTLQKYKVWVSHQASSHTRVVWSSKIGFVSSTNEN